MMQTNANEGLDVSRNNIISRGRPGAVWCGVTAAAGATVGAVPDAWAAVALARGAEEVAELLVATCVTGLALALAWLWVITTVTAAELLSGRTGPGGLGTGGATRRLVLVACGVAVLAGTSVPAMATSGDGQDLLVGLSLPERAVAPVVHHHRRAQAVEAYVVQPGDSLWSIARTHPGPTTSVDQRWRAIWAANRDVVGDDPDLIVPGQTLSLPTIRTTHDPHSDGDR